MSEKAKFEAYEKKLQNTCEENNLTYRFFKDDYPIVLKIMPTGGMDGQLDMLENAEETGFISPDAFILFAYKNGSLEIKTSETFTISEALFGKFKNLYKNLLFFWLLHFNREVLTKKLLSAQSLGYIGYNPINGSSPKEKQADGAPSEGVQTNDDTPPCDDADDDGADAAMEYEGPEDDAGDGGEANTSALAEFAKLVDEAEKIVREDGGASTSRLQKRLNIGYSQAARLMEALEARNVVGAISAPGMREVLPLASEG